MRRLLSRTQQRQLSLQRSNTSELEAGGDDGYDDIDLHIAYRRPNLVPCDDTCNHQDDGLSDHIIFRLWLARQFALKKFKEVHG